MVKISYEAAHLALSLGGYHPTSENILRLQERKGFDTSTHYLAQTLEELWEACPEKRPIDKQVLAMREALKESMIVNTNPHIKGRVEAGRFDKTVVKMVSAYIAKLAELEI
jgi:recombinational DNA repair protein RecR